MTLLSVRNLSLAIHGLPILSDVSFDIAPGETFGLVGESGSGKSMTALAVLGLLPPGARVSGEARFTGDNLLALPERRLTRIRGNEIGMIFQEPMTALNPMKTIGDQVAETLLIHRAATRAEARAVAREKLARVGLPGDRFPLSRYPHELSGGQRQRVAIAMAIALRPKLLIADEPTTALDVTTQAQILDLLEGLTKDEEMALMLITHDLAVVAGMASHVAVMQSGRIVENGRTDTVFRRRAHDYTRRLFAASEHQPLRRPQTRPDTLLTVEDAVREYVLPRPSPFAPHPRLRAVDGVSLRIRQGESVGLVGESGCGKSTLTRAILGLDPVQSGTIRLESAAVTAGRAMPRAVRARMQVVFQDPYGSFNPRHQVSRLIAEPFHLTGTPNDARDRVAAALEEVGLAASDMEKYIHEFSGGQRQRIAIARALIIRPDLIVLDEAVSALDVRVRAQVLDLLVRLQESHGLAYLFVSHDLSVVRSITDRVLVMQSGRIVEEGETERVFAAPSHPYTQRLIAATPVIPADWKESA
ncbi:Glutathione import ATP-binding protein GsiA [Defluviimonas aquaemixtae]|uniref:Glutathione import ATP-binding protein GsiA n=1 Tax=Albidovulum aquaemixtae TaxID=1542388 RepID=A0A2R8BM36_9RHOB|nr:dipeptide ABC transporter ATP-binding protein [Defluviimonas aquaemixtae]SPH24488.1 Glutathione import ATP-binding protein GsiA [Defluviimonas aquaemixtae]